MLKLLQSPWAASLAGCLLYLATTTALIRPEQFAGARALQRAGMSANNDPSWRFRNPEFEQWLEELKAEKETLAQRDKDLRELQTRLEAERSEILAVTQAVYQLQREFDKNVVRIKDQQVENLKRQAKVLAGMSPEGAAAMLNQAPDEEIVRLLFTLKPDAASAILDSMSKMGRTEAKRAVALTERLRTVLPPAPNNPSAAPGG